MVSFRLSALALFFLQTLHVLAVDEQVLKDEVTEPSTSGDLKLNVAAQFPQSEIFGVKLVNGNPTECVISYENNEPEPVKVLFIGGSLETLKEPRTNVKNLTAQRASLEIPAGEKTTLTYTFSTELHAQDLRLIITSVVTDAKDAFYTVPVYNETVSIVEAPTSILDPQIIFLYLILAGVFGGTIYFIYQTWFTTLFPQKRRGGKGGERAKFSSKGGKKVDPADQTAVLGADGPAVTSGSKTYDESWIPAQHLQRPEARRVGSGRSSTPKTKRAA